MKELASKTTNYKFHKIDLADSPPDIAMINPNWDEIDRLLKSLSDAIGGIDLGTLSQAITNVNNRVTTHLDDKTPHRFSDGTKTYEYGFKTNAAKDGLIFVYGEVV